MPALVSSADERLLAEVTRLATQGAAGVSALLGLFEERSWAVRRAVVTALSSGDEATLDAVADALVERRSNEPAIAGMVDALSAARVAVEPRVAALLRSDRAAVLCDAAQIAGRRRDRSAVPRLLELTQHADDNVALAAVEALGRIGGADAIERLMALAEGDNFFRAFPAIEMLGTSRDARALPVLERLLKKPLYATEAARALGRIGSGRAVLPLALCLEHAPDSLIRVVAESLGAIHDASNEGLGPPVSVSRTLRAHTGPGARAKVTRALSSAEGNAAIALGRLLIWLAEEESVWDFIPMLGTSDAMTELAVEGLTKLSALAHPEVLSALARGPSELRARLLPAVTGLADANAAIIACLSDSQPAVRALACHALARSNASSAVPGLFALLTDADLGVVHAAVGAIQALGSEVTEQLAMATLSSGSAAARRAALRIVLYFGYPGALDAARRALESDDARLRETALAGLQAIDDPAATQLLLEMSSHPQPRTRAAAVRALGHLRGEPALEAAVRAATEDPDAWVRYYACQSLGRLQVTSAVDLLLAHLEDDADQVKMGAVEALAALVDPLAGEALVRAAQSANLEVQRAAIVGLGTRKEAALRGTLLDKVASPDASVRLVALTSLAAFPDAEPLLEAAALDDADAGVRSTALELLANLSNASATLALARLLARDSSHKDVITALLRNIDARISSILALLGDADDALASTLVAILARAETRATRAALDIAFESGNAASRRATARIFAQLLDAPAKVSLARAATVDDDAEVRLICSAAIA